jgi:hypothetical protein
MMILDNHQQPGCLHGTLGFIAGGILLLGITMLGLLLCPPVQAAVPQVTQQAVEKAAEAARMRCLPLIDDDNSDYDTCIKGLLRNKKSTTPERLGIEYLGFVGAMSAYSMSIPWAEHSAKYYLKRFRVSQKKLGIDDQTLCRTVPGNCVVRLAQTKKMEYEVKPKV